MDEATRSAVCGAAVRAAQAVDYVGAGTIEFIADASEGLRADRIWFMEMNTRLQVEHPVTEEITGQDLVEWQLRVASGEQLPLSQDELAINGCAIEARLYAEDPAKGFLPSIGKLEAFDLGDDARVETGVEQGGEVSPFYDPMIAKVITHGSTREEAREALTDALASAVVWPVKTNAGFLVTALSHPDFVAGRADTGLIERAGEALMPPVSPSSDTLADAAASLADGGPLAGFRLNATKKLSGYVLVDGVATPADWTEVTDAALADEDEILLAEGGQTWAISRWRASSLATGLAGDGSILAPMPGRVIAVEVRAGDAVVKGQKLLTLEAMKMEHSLTAPFDGTVSDLCVVMGGQVVEGALLAQVDPVPE